MTSLNNNMSGGDKDEISGALNGEEGEEWRADDAVLSVLRAGPESSQNSQHSEVLTGKCPFLFTGPRWEHPCISVRADWESSVGIFISCSHAHELL